MIHFSKAQTRISATDSTDASSDSCGSRNEKAEVPGRTRLKRLSPRTGSVAEKRRRRLTRLRKSLAATSSENELQAGLISTPPIYKDHNAAAHNEQLAAESGQTKTNATPDEPVAWNSNELNLSHGCTEQVLVMVRRKNSLTSGDSDKSPEEELTGFDSQVSSDTAGEYRVLEPVPKAEESYGDWFGRVIVRNRWMSLFTTFYVHWIAALLMAAILVHGPEQAARLLLNATFAEDVDPEPEEFEVIVPLVDRGHVAERPQPAVTAFQENALQESNPDLAQEVMSEVIPENNGRSTAATEQSMHPSHQRTVAATDAPSDAVSSGSFSVWTEPSEPVAGKPYRIIIQVRLPESVEGYTVSDLQGVVVGSDGYRKTIPGAMTGPLPVENGYARLIIPIVSADARVRDTVYIRSALLKETQKLLLQF